MSKTRKHIIGGVSLLIAGVMLMVAPFHLLTLSPLLSIIMMGCSLIPYFFGIGILALLQSKERRRRKEEKKVE